MRDRVLITGASGFVGYHLILEALKNNLEVFAAVREKSDIRHLKELPVHFIYHTFSDQAVLCTELEKNGYQYIVHAAGRTRAKNQQEYNESNAELTRILAGAAVSCRPGILKKFVFISSLAAIGPNKQDDGPITADHIPQPLTAYGKSKLLAEEYLSQIPGLPLITLRPTAVYGPRERDLFVIIKAIAGGLEPYIGSKPQKLSFVYVKDLAALTIRSLFKASLHPAAYTISDGGTYSREEFAATIKHLLGRRTFKFNIPVVLVNGMAVILEKISVFTGKSPVLNVDRLKELTASNWSCSIAKAEKELEYIPAYNLTLGLEETIDWYKKNSWLN